MLDKGNNKDIKVLRKISISNFLSIIISILTNEVYILEFL